MRLNYIELFGFKSFADRTRLKIDNKISAIVGPNGSGKSNISDAVKWVLGEQSAKSLRGSKMEDVIFSGTEDKKEMNMAEVSISLDNTSHAINLPYEEIVITRRVYRSGESEYLINKSQVRLKDIRTILMDTGIGKDGYSLIGQGRVDSILSASSEDRREVFEEASGISKYKYKKVDSENKLVRNEEVLSEIESVYKAKNSELKILEKQATNAKKALSLLKRLEILELSQLKTDLLNNRKSKENLEKKISGYKENLQDNTKHFNKLNDKLSPYQEKIKELQFKIEEYNNIITKSNDELYKLKSNIELLKSNNEFIKKDINRVRENIEKRKDKNIKLNEKLEKSNNELVNENINLKEIEKEISDYQNKIRTLNNKIDKENESFNTLKDKRIKIKTQYDQLNIRYSTQVELKKNYNKLEEKASIERKNLLEKYNKSYSHKEELEKELYNLNSEASKLQTSYEENKEKFENGKLEIEKVKTYLENNNRKLFEIRSEKSIRSNIYNNFEGYYKPVQSLLKIANKNENIKKRFKGVLAELIQVDEKYQRAIDVSLGSSLQNIVVNNEEDGRFLIEFIKTNKLGRITFLPISSISSSLKIPVQSKAIANACDVIEYPEELDGIIKHFLSRTLIVENLEDAIITARAVKGARVISLDGDIINSWGSMVGGSYSKKGSTLINRKKELDDLIRQEKTSSLESEKLLKKLEQFNKEAEITSSKIVDTKNSLNSIKDLTLTKNEEYQRLTFELDSLNERLKTESENNHYSNEDLSKAENELELLKVEYESIEKEYKEKLEIIDKETKECIEFEKKLIEIRNNREISNRDINILKNTILEIKESLENNKEDDKNETAYLYSLRNDYEKNRETVESSSKDINEINKKSIENKSILEELTENIDKEKGKLGDDQILLEKYKTDISKLNNEIYKLTVDLDNKKEREISLYDSYKSQNDISQQELLFKLKTLEDVEINKEETRQIKSDLSKIGYFDTSSIEKFDVLKKEVDELKTQIDDLKETRKDIKEMIKDLEVKMRKIFNISFKEINERFSKIFKILFDGGKAEVIMGNGDILEADIEIVAQPPGKKLSNLGLLSGGEKALTAIALLFAIFETRPAPFCILDEIDSALDEANIARYKKYLFSLTDRTQFIIITHRKSTMEVADILYGVTMQEKGVSTLITLDLEDYKEE